MFVAVIFMFSYVIPMSLIIYYYSQIVNQVFKHEKALREQVKPMFLLTISTVIAVNF